MPVSGPSAAVSGWPGAGRWPSRLCRARSWQRCPTPSTQRLPPRSGSQASPAGCPSPIELRSAPTTASSCSGRLVPQARWRSRRRSCSARRTSSRPDAIPRAWSGRSSSGPTRGRARRRLRRADVRVRPALRRAARAGGRRRGPGSQDRPARPVRRAGRDAAVGCDPLEAPRALRVFELRRAGGGALRAVPAPRRARGCRRDPARREASRPRRARGGLGASGQARRRSVARYAWRSDFEEDSITELATPPTTAREGLARISHWIGGQVRSYLRSSRVTASPPGTRRTRMTPFSVAVPALPPAR